MNYDLSEFNSETYGEPICFTANADGSLTLYFGHDAGSLSHKQDGVILADGLFPVGELTSFSDSVECIEINHLKHSTWVEFVFPLTSFCLVVLGLSMIYRIIIKRLLP